jgi:hypothetical protein
MRWWAAAVVLLVAGDARASVCWETWIVEYEVDPSVPDDQPPARPVRLSVAAAAPEHLPACSIGDGCQGMIEVVLELDDDVTPPEDLGFLVRHVGGELPPGVMIPPTAIAQSYPGVLTIPWVRTPGVDDEAHSPPFTLEISAVDRHGNVSDPIYADISVREGPPEYCGCAAGRGAGAPGLLFLLAFLALHHRSR